VVENLSRGSVRHWLITALRVVVLITAIATLTFEGAKSSSSVFVSAILVAVTLIAMYLIRANDRSFRIWAIYILGFILFIHLRDLADKVGLSTRFEYVIDLDETLFSGIVPTVWLQERFASSLEILNLATAGVYLSYFLAPHAVGLALWRWKPDLFRPYVAAFLGTCYLGLVIYFIIPTAPPWLAAEVGYLPEILRLTEDVGRQVYPTAFHQGIAAADSNPVAAMPSLHVGLTTVIALAALRLHRGLAVAGLVYAGAMIFSVVYLGEHYVCDAIAGVLSAVVAWRLVGWWWMRRTVGLSRRKELVTIHSSD
jgi:hypothetical protein